MSTKKKKRPSIFGRNIDKRCPNYSFLEKFFVLIGIFADEEQSKRYEELDRKLDQRRW